MDPSHQRKVHSKPINYELAILLTANIGRSIDKGVRFAMNHPIFARLKSVIESPTDSLEW